MKKLSLLLIAIIIVPLLATPYFMSSLNPENQYILGCEVGKLEISTGLFAVQDNKPVLVRVYKVPTGQVPDLIDYIAKVVKDIKQQHNITVHKACFAVPGNTNAQKNYIKAPHLPFDVDGPALEQATGIARVLVVNDFECVGFGVQAIDTADITVLHAGRPREHGTKVIVGAGAGLGSGLMLWDTQSACYMPSPLSYSFVDFSPNSERELQLACYLQKETGSRSWGKVLGASGGITRIYDFLNAHAHSAAQTQQYTDYLDIFAHRTDDQCCKNAVDFYMHLYARLIRNVVYAQLPYNGLYIVNTVAERYPELFTDQAFMQEVFNTDNQYLYDYMQEIPVYLVCHPQIQLYGAALYALVYTK